MSPFWRGQAQTRNTCVQRNQHSVQKPILQALVAQLCSREGQRERRQRRQATAEKQLGLAEKPAICQHYNCSTGNNQPTKYSSARTLLPPEEVWCSGWENSSTGLITLQNIYHLTSATLNNQSKEKNPKQINLWEETQVNRLKWLLPPCIER